MSMKGLTDVILLLQILFFFSREKSACLIYRAARLNKKRLAHTSYNE